MILFDIHVFSPFISCKFTARTYRIMACDISSICAGTDRPVGAGSESNITCAHGYFHN